MRVVVVVVVCVPVRACVRACVRVCVCARARPDERHEGCVCGNRANNLNIQVLGSYLIRSVYH